MDVSSYLIFYNREHVCLARNSPINLTEYAIVESENNIPNYFIFVMSRNDVLYPSFLSRVSEFYEWWNIFISHYVASSVSLKSNKLGKYGSRGVHVDHAPIHDRICTY